MTSMPEVYSHKSPEHINQPHWMQFSVKYPEGNINNEIAWVFGSDTAKAIRIAKSHVAYRHHLAGTREGTLFFANATAEQVVEADNTLTQSKEESVAGSDYDAIAEKILQLEEAITKLDVRGPMLDADLKLLTDLHERLEEKRQLELDFSKK